MTEERLRIEIKKNLLSDSDFNTRASKELRGEIKKSLSLELADVSERHETEALALVLIFPKAVSEKGFDRYIFRVDRQSLEDLTRSLGEFLEKPE